MHTVDSRNSNVRSYGKRDGQGKRNGSTTGAADRTPGEREVMRIFRRKWQHLRAMTFEPGEFSSSTGKLCRVGLFKYS